MMEQDAAPAGGGNATSALGTAPGLRPGEIGSPARELADGGPLGLPEVRRSAAQKGPVLEGRRLRRCSRQKRGPDAEKTPRWSAARRPRPPKEDAAN